MGHPNGAESRGYPIVSSLTSTQKCVQKRMVPVGRTYARPFLETRVAVVKVNLPPSVHLLPTTKHLPSRTPIGHDALLAFWAIAVNELSAHILTLSLHLTFLFANKLERLYREREFLSLIHSRIRSSRT